MNWRAQSSSKPRADDSDALPDQWAALLGPPFFRASNSLPPKETYNFVRHWIGCGTRVTIGFLNRRWTMWRFAVGATSILA
jgi:hypothetical protein